MKCFHYLILIGFVIVFGSCTHETTLQPDLQETVYFNTQVLPIFQNTCAVSAAIILGQKKRAMILVIMLL
jgi:hypothetical protein